jgi:hypothetical protein
LTLAGRGTEALAAMRRVDYDTAHRAFDRKSPPQLRAPDGQSAIHRSRNVGNQRIQGCCKGHVIQFPHYVCILPYERQ